MKTIDVREIAPKNRHSLVFESFEALKENEVMHVLTDHDPKPLFYQFDAERKGQFSWKDIHRGPDVWEFSVTRVEHSPTVEEITRTYPGAMAVFNREQIDYCCHGDQPFDQAARSAGYSPEELIRQIESAPASEERLNYEFWSASMLCDFIEMNHHNYIRHQLPRIREIAEKVLNAHGQTHPWLVRLNKRLQLLEKELMEHLQKEERDLFPKVRESEGSGQDSKQQTELLAELRNEHEDAGNLMKEIRKLTGNYTPPADGCHSFRQLCAWLEDFEKDLYAHVHLENNVLFRKLSSNQV